MLLERLPNLKLISQTGRSTNHLDLAACTDLGIAVCAGTRNSPAAPTELTWALILASRRHIPIEAARMKADLWPSTLAHRLAGTTLGVYGLGAIGTPVANIGRAFGMRILVWGREKSLQRARDLGARAQHAGAARHGSAGHGSASPLPRRIARLRTL